VTNSRAKLSGSVLQRRAPSFDAGPVIGYSELAAKTSTGIRLYRSPAGFVSQGRNLWFLRRTANPSEFEVAVPVYEPAIRLADSRPYYTNDKSTTSVRFTLTQEFESALVQFDANDVSDIDHLFDLLGKAENIAELSRFSKTEGARLLEDSRRIEFHRVAVLRNGELIDDPQPRPISLSTGYLSGHAAIRKAS
jgi:hypothetical protein